MVFILARTFLACLPLRAGVWVLALVGLLLGVAGAVCGWMEVVLLESHPVQILDQIALFTQAITFSLLGFLSCIGFCGGITNSRSVAYIYGKMIAIHLVVTLLSLGLTLYMTFRPTNAEEVLTCLRGSGDEYVIQFCQKGISVVHGLPLLIYGGVLLAQLYAYIIAVNYAEKLELDDAAEYPGSLKAMF